MDSFTFSCASLPAPLTIEQEAQREIGFKVYPGSLVLLQHFERHPPPPGSVVLELGAGVCALPSIVLSHGGCHAIATDVPVMLDLLATNCERNAAVRQPDDVAATQQLDGTTAAAAAGSCSVAPLTWGDADTGGPPPGVPHRVDLIIGADVVYHEPLIAPLLATCVRLTDGPSPPPRIVLSYVQRFKRAKAFLRAARKHFDVRVEQVADVVDYDTLTWGLHALQQRVATGQAGEGGLAAPPSLHLTPSSAGFDEYCALVIAAAAGAVRSTDVCPPLKVVEEEATTAAPSTTTVGGVTGVSTTGGGAVSAAVTVSAAKAPGDDDDDGDGDDDDAEDEPLTQSADHHLSGSAPATHTSEAATSDAADTADTAAAAARRKAGAQRAALLASAALAAAALGVELAAPLHAYIYTLERRR